MVKDNHEDHVRMQTRTAQAWKAALSQATPETCVVVIPTNLNYPSPPSQYQHQRSNSQALVVGVPMQTTKTADFINLGLVTCSANIERASLSIYRLWLAVCSATIM